VEEMRVIRRSLLEDFSVTPELVVSCRHEIETNCKNGGGKDNHQGNTIHCLMKAAMDQNNNNVGFKDQKFGPQCEKALNLLLAEAQMNSDWKVMLCNIYSGLD
jgi:Golgi apparatus protein 1